MALQLSTAVRNALLDSIETTIGVSPTLEIRSGAPPANCGAAASGTVLVTAPLPADWMAAAGTPTPGAKTLLGTWQDTSADATGTAGHYRINAGATCHVQGTVTATGGGGDMTVDNVSIAAGQQVTITSFTLNAGGA